MKILLQAGHYGRTTGATGAPNEASFNFDIVNKVAWELVNRGFVVSIVGADPKPDEVGGDWDLFLAVHYDADMYGTGGGFVDTPDPTTDGATAESQRIAQHLEEEYFKTTGIVNHPERKNKNTKFYYMWKFLSYKTPCVIIECGVGMHTPDDHTILHFNRPLVVEGIVRGICKAFGVSFEIKPVEDAPVASPEPITGVEAPTPDDFITPPEDLPKESDVIFIETSQPSSIQFLEKLWGFIRRLLKLEK